LLFDGKCKEIIQLSKIIVKRKKIKGEERDWWAERGKNEKGKRKPVLQKIERSKTLNRKPVASGPMKRR
jgi:hypothetical protein